MLNLPVQALVNQTECLPNRKSKRSKLQGNYPQLLYWKNKQERQKRKDQAWRRLATVNKIAQKAGFTLPNYSEKRTIPELLKQHGEYSYLTGKKLGTYYLSTLDIDLRKEEFPKKMIAYLEKSIKKFTNCLQVSYDKTKKGLHVDILTPEPLPNEQIYFQGWGKTWNIGSIQSLGKYVVGEDKDKAFIKSGKWYWKVKNNEEVKNQLAKFFLRLGKLEQLEQKTTENRQLLANQTIKTVRYQAWDYNLNQAVMREYLLLIEKPYKKQKEPASKPAKKQHIQAKILSKQETNLEHLWKVFYLDWKSKTTGYFLVNDYHREKEFNDLDIGSVRNILLVSGVKHRFFSRMWG